MSLWLSHPLFLPSIIVGLTILLWATSLLPEFMTALLFFAAAMIAKIAPPEVIFGGFASSAFWLVFSGFVLGIAIRKTGLADRAARALSSRLTDSWPLMVGSVVLLSYALAFVMPSNMGRIALLMPIVAAVCHYPARQRPESGDERRGGGIVRYPSELSALFTAAYAGARLAQGGGADRADMLAVPGETASAARSVAAAADEPR